MALPVMGVEPGSSRVRILGNLCTSCMQPKDDERTAANLIQPHAALV